MNSFEWHFHLAETFGENHHNNHYSFGNYIVEAAYAVFYPLDYGNAELAIQRFIPDSEAVAFRLTKE